MKITLLRHGRPDFDWDQRIKGTEMGCGIEAYDLAGIIDTPPEKLKAIVSQHNIVVCSDLTRSLQSAKAMGVRKIHVSDPIFREMSIPYFNNMSITFSVKLWVLILRGLWFLGFSKNSESIVEAKQRAKLASEKLIDLVVKNDSVLFVGHGFINHYIAKELLANNWSGSSSPGEKYWEFVTYNYKKI